MLEKGSIVICAGGGGIPTYYDEQHNLQGVEAVIDKDLCSALLAENLDADLFIIATDVSATFVDWGKPTQKQFQLPHLKRFQNLVLQQVLWDQKYKQPSTLRNKQEKMQ